MTAAQENPLARAQPRIQALITGRGPLTPVMLKLAWPVVIMMYLQGAYNIIDTIWVGHLLGRAALAGIATGGFVLWSIFGLTQLATAGIAAVVARRIGENELPQAERTAAQGLLYALVLSVLLGAAIWVLMPALYALMGTDPEVTLLGSAYLRVLLAGSPVIFLSFMIYRIFQAAGDTVTPTWLTLGTLSLNTVLDPLLMLGLAGFPRMGVAGAALATVISRLILVGLGLGLLLARRRLRRSGRGVKRGALITALVPRLDTGYLGLRVADFGSWDWRLLGVVLRIGLPNAVSQTMFPLVYMFLTRLPAGYGPEFVAALRIGHTVEGVSFFLAMGFSIAAATCVGQNLGAGQTDRAARCAWFASLIVSGVLLLISVAFFCLPREIAAVFSPDGATIAAAALYLRILAVSQVFMGLEIVLGGAFAGAGDTLPPMMIFVPLNIARIPLAYLLVGPLGLGVAGVWWAISGSSIFKGVAVAGWFARGGWKTKRV